MQSFRPALLCVVAWAMSSCGGMAQPAQPSPSSDINEAVWLRRELKSKDAEIAQLQVEIVRLRTALNAQIQRANSVVALSDRPAFFGGAREFTPSSSLSRESAQQIAKIFSLFKSGSSYCTVLPTGSMKPFFDEKAVLLMENAPFSSLQVGDIVTYRHPSLGIPVVHRLVIKDRDRFWAKGDANERMDDVYVTPENYLRRVYGMIYSKE
jgi:signal peptidase I